MYIKMLHSQILRNADLCGQFNFFSFWILSCFCHVPFLEIRCTLVVMMVVVVRYVYDKLFMQFLFIARGSLCELETQVIIAKNLGLAADVTLIEQQVEKLFGLIGGLVNSLKKQV